MGPGMSPQMDTPTKDAKFSAMDSMMVCLEVYRSRYDFLIRFYKYWNGSKSNWLFIYIGHLKKYMYTVVHFL